MAEVMRLRLRLRAVVGCETKEDGDGLRDWHRHRHNRESKWYGFCNIPNRRWCNCATSTSRSSSSNSMLEDSGGGGKMVVDLVGAFNQITQRMSSSSSSESIVFNALKLCIPLLSSLPLLPGKRTPLSRALSVALLVADLRMDAEVISAALLLHPLQANSISLSHLRSRVGEGTAHLLHDFLRLSSTISCHDSSSSSSSTDLRRFCLTFYDARALTLELALSLDSMVHEVPHLPRFHQHLLSLRALNMYAPLAHALGLSLSLHLEDLSFRCLFPYSYLYLDAWLRTRTHVADLDSYKDTLLSALNADPCLSHILSHVSVVGRYKSRYSTMKKLLKDGRTPQQVNDILGLRVVLHMHMHSNSVSMGDTACYTARRIVRQLWTEVSNKSKDYIANPKPNGYRSLHMAVDIGNTRPLMEVQIRTAEMDSFAVGGAASHSFYKAGLTDPHQAKRLKAIMVAAADLAALRLKDLSSPLDVDGLHPQDRVFRLLDKNGDGRISIDELKDVMEELGAPPEDARHMMHLLDSNSDGSLSSDEFHNFQRQLDFMRTLQHTDDHYKSLLNHKLHFAAQDTPCE